MFKSLDEMLPDRVNRLKTGQPADAAAACRAVDAALDDLWQHAVPMRASGFRAGRVTVAVVSSAWGQEIATKADRIIAEANRRLKKTQVKELKTRVAPDEAERKPD